MDGTNTKKERGADHVPVFHDDLFDPSRLADAAPTYRMIRDMGDVVWSPSLDMFVIGRFADVQRALRDDQALVSGRGVSVNRTQLEDKSGGPTGVLTMDGEQHAHVKRLLMKPLLPKALQDLKEQIETEAARIVERLANGQPFEAMSTLAAHLPTRIVADLVGLNEAGHERLLRWSLAAFDTFGPADSPRTLAALPTLMELLDFATHVTRETVVPGSWAANLFDAVDRGDITVDTARLMIFDYTVPSLDTTILATGQMLWSMARVAGAFDAVRADRGLIPSAVYESVRLASPIRGFSRYVAHDFRMAESVLPQGSRVYLLNASANWDERRYPNPQHFDVARNPRDNVAWGHSRHLCPGMHLARLEMESLLGALVRSVRRIEVGEPVRLVNNFLQGYSSLPLTLHPV